MYRERLPKILRSCGTQPTRGSALIRSELVMSRPSSAMVPEK
jgi:hypothetical protein